MCLPLTPPVAYLCLVRRRNEWEARASRRWPINIRAEGRRLRVTLQHASCSRVALGQVKNT